MAVLIAILLTWPMTPQIAAIGRADSGDGRFSIWNVAWVAHALLTNPRGVFHANIFHPHPHALAFSEANLGAGALAVPVYWATGNPYAAHNSAVLLGFVFAWLAMYALVRRLASSPVAAAVGATAFTYCPYVYSHTAHVQLLMTFGIPLTLLAAHRFVDRPGASRAVALGLALATTALFCAYYGIFTGLLVGLAVLFYAGTRGVWRNARYWAFALLAAGVALLPLAPIARVYLTLQEQTGFARPLDEAVHYSARWGYLASATYAHRWMLAFLPGWQEVLFPGFLILGFGLAGAALAFRRPAETPAPAAPVRETAAFYLLVAILAFWASLGPNAGLYTLLFRVIPIFSYLRAPSRLGLIVGLALAVLASLAIARLLQRFPRAWWLAPALVAIAVGESLVPLPLQRVEPPPTVYFRLADLPAGPVLELPFYWRRIDFHRHTEHMLWSTFHWKPLINGYSDNIPPEFRDIAEPLSTFPSPEAFRLLRERRARYVVIHLHKYARASASRVVEALETRYHDALTLRAVDPDPLRERRADRHPLNQVRLYEITTWPEGETR
jgi:hypothetical protein